MTNREIKANKHANLRILIHGAGVKRMNDKEYREYLKSPTGKYNKTLPITDKMKPINMITNETLFPLMEKYGVTRYRLYTDLGIAYSSFRGWEENKYQMTKGTAIKLDYYFKTKFKDYQG